MVSMEHGYRSETTRAGRQLGPAGDGDSIEYRLMDLEKEKIRLQGLVTELLFKNQQLRESLDRMSGPAAAKPRAFNSDEKWFA